MALFKLNDGMTELSVAPALGGAIAGWRRLQDNVEFFRALPPKATALTARQLAAFPLIPWSNRIAEGGVDTPEGWFDLPANTDSSLFAMHGSVWQHPWEVVEQDNHHLKLSVVLKSPVALKAVQLIRLYEGKLTLQFEVTHLDDKPFWHGYGWHPFFIRTPFTQLKTSLHQMWLSDEQQLSTQLIDLPDELNFSQLKSLPSEKVDNAFTKWSGHCLIQQPDLDYQLQLYSEDMTYLILYCPQHQPFFCAEPVSHPVNAHHMSGKPGLSLLKKNQQLHWAVSVTYQCLN